MLAAEFSGALVDCEEFGVVNGFEELVHCGKESLGVGGARVDEV